MKIEYGLYGGFTFTAEDGRDMLWLAEMIENTDKRFRPILSNYFRVDMESMCVVKGDDDKTQSATDVDLEECIDKDDHVWGGIESVTFSPFGHYIPEEEENRCKKALSNFVSSPDPK